MPSSSSVSINQMFKNLLILVCMVYLVILFLNKTDEFSYVRKLKTTVYSSQEIYEPLKIKTILLWNPFFSDSGYEFGMGGEVFRDHGCPVYDCFITDLRTWQPVQDFDAIVFHGAEYNPKESIDFPIERLHSQRYVYFNMESPLNRPAPNNLNHFFNWTMTYRLDSDINVPYYQITNYEGDIVAPSDDPEWNKSPNMTEYIMKVYLESVNKKTKQVAWFASNCKSKNKRESHVRELELYTKIDVYGACGKYKCPRENEQACFDMLKNDYFFYLAFENSNCEDYVTEKVTNALMNDVVPIIYGGANLTKFLPPGSYINANEMTATELAAKMNYLQENPKEYLKYFNWKNFYRVHVHQKYAVSPFCKLCEMLHARNNEEKMYNINDWWHGTKNNPTCYVQNN